jgi:predicted nucleotidyltransferase
MVSMEQIREMGQRIGREFHPDRVLLFGSYARGDQGADSDVDLLVIMPTEGKSIQKAAEIRLSLDHSISIDLLVRTPDELHRRLEMGDFFMRDIVEKGVVLYESHHR